MPIMKRYKITHRGSVRAFQPCESILATPFEFEMDFSGSDVPFHYQTEILRFRMVPQTTAEKEACKNLWDHFKGICAIHFLASIALVNSERGTGSIFFALDTKLHRIPISRLECVPARRTPGKLWPISVPTIGDTSSDPAAKMGWVSSERKF